MADLYSTLGSNALKTLGDGASGVGPYTRFGTPQLTAIQVTTSALNESTSPATANSTIHANHLLSRTEAVRSSRI